MYQIVDEKLDEIYDAIKQKVPPIIIRGMVTDYATKAFEAGKKAGILEHTKNEN